MAAALSTLTWNQAAALRWAHLAELTWDYEAPIMTLKTLRKTIFEAGTTFGNTDHFGETVTYTAVDGNPITVDVGLAADEWQPRQGEMGDWEEDRLWVSVAKDALCARSGIDTPTPGDTLLRSGDSAPWVFSGEIRNATSHSWELLFVRVRPRRYRPAGHPMRTM